MGSSETKDERLSETAEIDVVLLVDSFVLVINGLERNKEDTEDRLDFFRVAALY
jgi:hypothetical protein